MTAHAAYGPSPQSTMAKPVKPGFFGGLFDFSFKTSVTTSAMKALYMVYFALVLMGFLATVGLVVARLGMNHEDVGAPEILAAVFALLVAPIVSFLSLLFGRIMFEMILVTFRLADEVTEINRKTHG